MGPNEPNEPNEGHRDILGSMLAWAVDVDQSPEEADEELRAAGVDVDGFLVRARERRGEA